MKSSLWILLGLLGLGVIAIPAWRIAAVAERPGLASRLLRCGYRLGGQAMSAIRWGIPISPYSVLLRGLPPLRVFLFAASCLK